MASRRDKKFILMALNYKPVAAIAAKHGVHLHLFAEDTQLYVPFEPEKLLCCGWRLVLRTSSLGWPFI